MTDSGLRHEVDAIQAAIDAMNNRVAALDRALALFSPESATAPDVSGAIDDAMDQWLLEASGFQKQHVRIEMVLPSGVQDGAHSTYFCPSGQWEPNSVIGYLNGRAMPSGWLLDRGIHSFRLGGGMPAELWPDMTLANPRELRVSYDADLTAASGDLTASGIMTRRISRVYFDTDIAAYNEFSVEVSASGVLVVPDPFFELPELVASFAWDAEVKLWLNGLLLQKEYATEWASGTTYGIGDRVYDGSGVYECHTFHTSSGAFDPSYFDSVDPLDIIYVGDGEIMATFPIEEEDYLEVQAPQYASI